MYGNETAAGPYGGSAEGPGTAAAIQDSGEGRLFLSITIFKRPRHLPLPPNLLSTVPALFQRGTSTFLSSLLAAPLKTILNPVAAQRSFCN